MRSEAAGIPNLAFKKAASGIGGFSYDKPGQIWVWTLQHSDFYDTFSSFARRTIEACSALQYNEGISNIVGKAWMDVGVDLRPAPTTTETSSKSLSKTEIAGITGLTVLAGLSIAALIAIFKEENKDPKKQ